MNKPKMEWVNDTDGVSCRVKLGEDAEIDYYITVRDDPAPGEIVYHDEWVQLLIDNEPYRLYFASIKEAKQAAYSHLKNCKGD